MTTVTLAGFLEDGISGIGGEHTGWQLHTDHDGTIEVDVEQIRAQALRYRQREVEISGSYTTRGYIERGPSEVLVAEAIRPAAPAKKT